MRTACTLLCGAVLAIAPAMAQSSAPLPERQGDMQGPPPGGGGGGRGGMNPERRVEMMQKMLGLTDDQTTQIKAILADGRTKMEALQADTTSAPKDKRAKMMSLREDENTKVEAVLTPDQKTKYHEMMERQRERQRDGNGGNGGAPPPPPPPQ